MKTRSLRREEWKAAREKLLVKEKEHPISRCVGGGAAAECRGWLLRRSTASRARWFGEPHRPVRGPPPADRLPRLLRAGGHDLRGGRLIPAAGVRRLLVRRRPGLEPRPPECAGHDARVRLARPQAEIRGLKERHGWEHIPWYTITDDFDKDFDVDEWHGHNAFIREGDRIYRTYFIDARGDEAMGTTWSYLDLSALGRQEVGRTRRRAGPRRRPTSGGSTTTRTARDRPHLGRAGGGARAGALGRGVGLLVVRGWIMLRLRATEGAVMHTKATLRMKRTFEASAQAVFDAFTSEEVMRRWWHAGHDWETPEATVDLRVGGGSGADAKPARGR